MSKAFDFCTIHSLVLYQFHEHNFCNNFHFDQKNEFHALLQLWKAYLEYFLFNKNCSLVPLEAIRRNNPKNIQNQNECVKIPKLLEFQLFEHHKSMHLVIVWLFPKIQISLIFSDKNYFNPYPWILDEKMIQNLGIVQKGVKNGNCSLPLLVVHLVESRGSLIVLKWVYFSYFLYFFVLFFSVLVHLLKQTILFLWFSFFDFC